MEELSSGGLALGVLPFHRFPILFRLFTAIAAHEIKMDLRACEKGNEIHFKNEVNGLSNRGYLRIFFPTETKCVLFFHKKSSIPYSRDRFSYGGIVIDARSASRFDQEDIEEWIQFLRSGLNPKFRPKDLRKSFPYTVPAD